MAGIQFNLSVNWEKRPKIFSSLRILQLMFMFPISYMKDSPDRLKPLNKSSRDSVEFFILDFKNKSFEWMGC